MTKKPLLFVALKSAVVISLLMVVCKITLAQSSSTSKIDPQPKLITLNLDSDTYQEIFDGPPATVGMYSGLVSLKPGDTVGHHNTEDYEEILIILKGEGQMIFENKETLALRYGMVAYCPPHTEHDVKNTGTLPLRYIYVAAKTNK